MTPKDNDTKRQCDQKTMRPKDNATKRQCDQKTMRPKDKETKKRPKRPKDNDTNRQRDQTTKRPKDKQTDQKTKKERGWRGVGEGFLLTRGAKKRSKRTTECKARQYDTRQGRQTNGHDPPFFRPPTSMGV